MRARDLAVAGIVVVLFGVGSLPTTGFGDGPASSPSTTTSVQQVASIGTDGTSRHVLRVERLPTNPIITPEMLPGHDGENITGSSLIRVPRWVRNPLGKYYLYFAHHRGQYIRLAYADRIEGPWKVYEPGTLKLHGTPCDSISHPVWAEKKHVASPDVHVDEKSRRIRMYFHCPAYIAGAPEEADSYKEVSFVANSKDGLSFEAQPEVLGSWFFRAFQWSGTHYALAMPGIFYRSTDGQRGFVKGPTLFTKSMRHSAVTVRGGTLLVFYSSVGDNPESILVSSIQLGTDWNKWKETAPHVVLQPEREWEGSSRPAVPSKRGPALAPVRELRDPAIFVDEGRTYLLYSVAGEQGIAVAEIHWQ